MSARLLLMLDDTDSSIFYSGGTWSHSVDTQWYLKSETWAKFTENSTQTGTFTLTFQGTSISITGSTPPPSFSQTFHVNIDNGSPSSLTYPISQRYMQWYTSPTLQEGSHTLRVDGLVGAVGVDFALIEVGQDTPLSGKTVIADDDDSAVQYSGSWLRSTEQFNPGVILVGFPLGGATHRSSMPGDSIAFRFSGNSIAVYGIFLWGSLGSLSMTYTLDGTALSRNYNVTTQSPEFKENFGDTENFLYFSQDNLSPGDHTLVIRIESTSNQFFILDYFTYKPSFSTLSTMPNLLLAQSSTSLPSTSSGFPSSNPTGRLAESSNNPSVAAVVGASIGGTLFAIFAVLFIFKWLKGRRQRGRNCITALVPEVVGQRFVSPFILDKRPSGPAVDLKESLPPPSDSMPAQGPVINSSPQRPQMVATSGYSVPEEAPPAYLISTF